MNILVVDDEIVSRKKMMKILSGFGTCDGVKTGKEALGAVKKALEEWRLYTLITLDISMPDISGVSVLTAIRKMETARGLSDDEKRLPQYNQETMETNIDGLYLAGVICGGMETHKWFIENSRIHAPMIISSVLSKKLT